MRIFKTIVVFIISGVISFFLYVLLVVTDYGLKLYRYDDTAWFWLLLVGLTLPAPIAISNYMYKNVFSPSAIANRKEKRQKELGGLDYLSKNYQILRKFQTVLYIFLVFDIIAGLIGGANISDMRGIPEWAILIYGIVWIFGLFATFCGIKIIDFIFDLDKVKSDKV